VRTVFRRCFLANFAVRPAALSARLPAYLRPDLHDDSAFLSVVIAEMHDMRPTPFPSVLGVTYTQVVYRAVVRCGSERGVYFLRSDADNGMVVAAGNLLTFFRFHLADVSWTISDRFVRFSLRPRRNEAASIDAGYDIAAASKSLPNTSRFATLSAAHSFLTELITAFGAPRRGGGVEAVRIRRTPWESIVVPDLSANYEAMRSGVLFGDGDSELDSVFYVANLDYHWDRLTTVFPSYG